MKIGVFLGYGPQVKLGKEGLGRYIGGLIKGFCEEKHEITVACPYWSIDTVNDLLESFAVEKTQINIISTDDYPPLWKLYTYLTKKSQRSAMLKRMLTAYVKKLENTLDVMASTDSSFKFVMRGLFFVICVLIGIIPCFILLSVLVLKKIVVKIINKRLFFIDKYKIAKYVLPKKIDLPILAFYKMTNAVILKLIKKINAQKDVDVWFIPGIFWPQVSNIRGNVVINAPDLVSQEFPQEFASVYGASTAIENCRETLLEGQYFITYCDFLRKKLLVEQYGKSEKQVVAIGHTNNDMYPYLAIENSLNKNLKSNVDWVNVFAHDIIEGYIGRNTKYIFYASQIRPNKNMLNLVKAYEYLLRKKFIYHKLLITADLEKETEVREYVRKNRLEADIISAYNIPAQTLAALYYCADLVVNPTLYEGGFPFTFGEGMSVGTPSVMSDIPQVREVLEPAGLDEIMFDPYDWKAIATKIEWALADLQGLYQKELPLYNELKKRTYSEVAKEYVKAFQVFMNK